MNKTKIVLDAFKSLKGACVSVLKECDENISSQTIEIYETELLKDEKIKHLLKNVDIPSSRYINFDMDSALDYNWFKNINNNEKINAILKTTYFTIKFADDSAFNHISDSDIKTYVGLINLVTTSILMNLVNSSDGFTSMLFKSLFERFINLKATNYDNMIMYYLMKNLRHETVTFDEDMTLKNIVKNESLMLSYDDIIE